MVGRFALGVVAIGIAAWTAWLTVGPAVMAEVERVRAVGWWALAVPGPILLIVGVWLSRHDHDFGR